MDLASTPVIKTDQTRNNPGAAAAALLKNVPTQQGRYLTALQQTAPVALGSSTPSLGLNQAAVAKQVAMNSSQGIVSRLTPLPVHPSSTYHVPRGAAAVANIAVPRTSLATPIRGPSTLQTIGVPSSNHSSLMRGAAPTVGIRPGTTPTLQVASPSAWHSSNSSTPSSTPRPHSTQTTIAHYSRASSMVTRLAAPTGSSRVLPDPTQRPVLLQTHKQIINQSQQVQQMHINDSKTFLKTGVSMGLRPQSTVAGAGGTGRPVMAGQAPAAVNRIGTSLPAVVSLHPHPTVLVQAPSVPLKNQQTHASKFLTQQPHLQIQSLPVNSLPPSSTIAVTTIATKPVSFSTTSTIAGVTGNTRPVHNMTAPSSTSKVLTPAESSVFLQAAHKPSASVTVPGVSAPSIVSIGSPMYTGSYQYEPPTGFPLQRRATFTPTPAPTPVTTPTSTRPASSIVTSGPPVRYNPVMVVDHNRTSLPVHSYATPTEGSCNQSLESSSAPAPSSQVQTPTKPNASPRPSILRKRDSEGSPMKAQKNLTPLLSTLTVIPPSSPPSPKRPESRGNGGGQSSGGSTAISATSSPGLGTGDPDSPPLTKQELHPEPPPLEMSPRKKPRKQQLTGNQMQEPKSEDEMEFISEEKYKKDSREGGLDDGVEHPMPKVMPKRPSISLLNSYRHTWKSRHHHFLRYSDVKPKDERRPTVSDLASQKQVHQKLNGWKIYHLSTQMEDLSDLETEVLEKLTAMLKVLERKPGKELDKDINRVNELIKGNIQRCKVIKDQMHEAKTQVMKIFDHKGHVTDILNRCSSKRSVKKRDRV